MYILVVNAGSSSLKYQLFDMNTEEVMAKGLCECIAIENGHMKHTTSDGRKYEVFTDIPNHSVATKMVIDALTDSEHGVISDMSEISAVGHRVVHGGKWLCKSCLVTNEVLANLKKCYPLAPLHTAAHIQGIEGVLAVLPNVPQVLVMDTAFHSTMPDVAKTYPVPRKVAEALAIRRYGAHGTSHRYVSAKAIEIMGGKKEGTKIVTCHLGNGSSISAVKDGVCIDTSMGLTPLAGVIMGSRTGDMDPAVVPYMIENYENVPKEDRPAGYEHLDISNVNNFMNKVSGLLGWSGVSSDMRNVRAAAAEGNADAQLALDILAYGIKKYIGAYAAAMNGLDCIVFTAGIGENDPELRENVINGLSYLGASIDPQKNAVRGTVDVTGEGSSVKIYVIPTNEELVIASDTKAIVDALK